MKRMQITLSLILVLALVITPIGSVHALENTNSFNLVEKYFQYLVDDRFDDLEELLSYEDREVFRAFITNPDNQEGHIGYFNYAQAEIVTYSMVSSDEIDMSVVDHDQRNRYTNWSCWDCVVDVTTYQETKYLTNGYNRFKIYTAQDENGKELIIECCRFSDYTYDEYGVTPLSIDLPVSAPASGTWTLPASITVQMAEKVPTADSTEENPKYVDEYIGSPVEVEFKQYCYNVTYNEVGYETFNEDARKAVAICVKQYGWNRTLVQKYANLGFDVLSTTSDQVYDTAKTPNSQCIAAVDATWNYMMLSCDLKLFCSFHVHSVNTSSYASYHGGILSQMGAADLGESGYDFIEILHYYYDYGTYNDEMTQGEISVFSLTHTAQGLAVKILGNQNYHTISCTVCGCTHGSVSHTWKYANSKYTCTACGYSTTTPPSIVASLEGVEISE